MTLWGRLDLSQSEGIAFYWWGSGGVDQNIDFEMRTPTGSYIGKFYDGPAEWRWVFLRWADLEAVDIDGSRPDNSDITGFYWTYHTDGVRRVDYIVGWRRQDLRGDFEVRQGNTSDLLGKFAAQVTAELLGKVEVQQSGSAELLGKFEAQATAEILAKFEVGGA
jgi:hypothetical protein